MIKNFGQSVKSEKNVIRSSMISLKQIRKSSNLTQTELANLLDITQQQYSRYEMGIRKISLELFLKILEVCNLEIKIVKK